jgi:uncharacterized protein (TIGR03032 family)
MKSPDEASERSADRTLPFSELRSVHTPSFAELLEAAGASVIVTTYQAGKVVILRARDGVLNTHFCDLPKPMGLASYEGRLAVGTELNIWELQNCPAACVLADEKYAKGGVAYTHDACYLPRRCDFTGDVHIHDLAWDHHGGAPRLVFVNTLFSCLAVRSSVASFEPIWQPKFVTALRPWDCCHLNGVAVRDSRAKYVTAFSSTSSKNGWRNTAGNCGVVVDVESDEILAFDLSMPHSPRWHNDVLWLLQSGEGSLGFIDLRDGRYETVAQFPGFARGLAFLGPYVFVGLSQVRETIFAGAPLVRRLPDPEQRRCGVWVIDTRTGESVGFCQFTAGVCELFAVEVLRGVRFPEVITEDKELIRRSYILPPETPLT